MRLAILTSHPIQYYAPLFRRLAQIMDLTVFFAHRATPADQAKAGFGVHFEWDTDLLSGYKSVFLKNKSVSPSVNVFAGCDTPEIYDYLFRGNFHALLVTGWYLKSFIQAIVAAKRLGLPVLVRGDSHLLTPRSKIKQIGKAAIYPLLLRAFNCGLYVGSRSHSYWRGYGFPEHRLFFSPHCVDTHWYGAQSTAKERAAKRSEFQIPLDVPVILFAGKLISLKRPGDIITAVARLNVTGIRPTILFAGSGPLASQLAQAGHESGVTIHQLGFCNQSKMPGIYAAADMLVLPSAHETWGLVANEALACGKPIIVSDAVGCAPDLAADDLVGHTYPVANIEALAEAIRKVICNPPPAHMIYERSNQYSVDAAANGILAALESTLGERSS